MSDLHELEARVLGLEFLVSLICVHLPRSTRESLLAAIQRLQAQSTVALHDKTLTEFADLLKERIENEE